MTNEIAAMILQARSAYLLAAYRELLRELKERR